MMTTDKAKKPTLMSRAIAVSPRVRIEGIRLAESHIRSMLQEGNAPSKVDYSFAANTVVDPDDKRISVHAQFTLTAKPKDQPASDSAPFLIDAEFVLDYEVKSLEGLTDDNYDAFGKVNGIYNAWPYWREYVQSTTVRLGLPPLTLPVLTGEAIVAMYCEKQNLEELSPSPNREAETTLPPSPSEQAGDGVVSTDSWEE